MAKQLSIIIPMYNAEKTIKKCLDSLLLPKGQMERLEVIVVDDGSLDRSAAYADWYRRKYPGSFDLVRKVNGGHGSAVNAGAARCSGRYLKVLDADDWMHTDSLGEVLKLLEDVDAQVVACGYDQCRMMPKEHVISILPGLAADEKVRYLDMEQLVREWERFRQIFCLHGLIYQTAFYKMLSYRMPEGVSYDDAFFFTVPCSHADRLCVIQTQLYVYRIGDPAQSISAKNREKRMHQMEAVIWSMIKADHKWTQAGREYWYRKLVSVVSDYYVTAFLRCSDKKRGRKAAQVFTGRLRRADQELYRRLKSRYWLLLGMGLCHRTEQDFERMLRFISCARKALDKTDRLLVVKTLVKSVLQQIFVIPAAAVYYKVCIQKKGVYHLIICGHIGDFLYTMGYADAFQKENGIKKLRVVSVDKFRGLAACYPKKGRSFYAVSEKNLHLLCTANRYAAGQLLFGRWKDCLVAEPANGFVQGFEYAKCYPRLQLKSCICQGVLKLKPDSGFELPKHRKYRKPRDLKGAAGSAAHRKILLCPYAQAIDYEDAGQFFRELAEKLEEKQYKIEINAMDGQTFFAGARVVSDSLEELFETFNRYEAVIGIRSGLLDLAVFAGCRVGALYPPGYGLADFYDLRQAAGPGQDVFQYQLTGDRKRDLDAAAAWIR